MPGEDRWCSGVVLPGVIHGHFPRKTGLWKCLLNDLQIGLQLVQSSRASKNGSFQVSASSSDREEGAESGPGLQAQQPFQESPA